MAEHLQLQPYIQVPACHRFLTLSDTWWDENLRRFPSGYSACNAIEAQRIPPVSHPAREILVDRYCPVALQAEIKSSEQNRDCLIRPYLGRRRVLAGSSKRPSKFTAFSLRNYPLHLDQMEGLGVSPDDIKVYAKTMAGALAAMHWAAGIDGNDVEFVLASPSPNLGPDVIVTNVLGAHAMWVLDFDLCREMPTNEDGVEQAVMAFFKNDPFYPRPRSSPSLWKVFREQYIHCSKAILLEKAVKGQQALLPVAFVEAIESRETASESSSQ